MRFLALVLITSSLALAGMSKHIASYDIQATLNHKAHTITGSETLTWVNDSPDSVSTLQFHLYMNAFRNTRSTFFQESGGQLRGDQFKGDEWGWVEVKKMRLASGADLTKAMRFIHPDDDNAEDRTVIEVPLPQPVMPGETIEVAIDFETKMPTVFARTGFRKDFYLVGQWFPKIGVWETAGFRFSTQGAWNCHQFHANSEFFANFGRYDVQLTVPSDMVIGATGEQTKRAENVSNKTTTYGFHQEDVTDFAWTVQPNYIRVERMFEAAKETTAAEIAHEAKLQGIPEDDVRLSDVKMIVLMQPEHREQIERTFHATRTAIKHFGLWYGRYPYKTITVVDPPHGAGGAGGMEYPTFITAGTSWRLPPESKMLEEVTVHEFGHQFWMQLVATNEFEESPLDEGFNTYSTALIMDKVYGGMGQFPFTVFGINLSNFFHLPTINDLSMDRAGFLSGPVDDDLLRKSWQYYDSQSYGINSYMRMSVTLDTLERIVGHDTMARIMRTYHQRYRFHHPTAPEFVKVASEVSGQNLDWFFNQFFFGNRLLDYRIGEVASVEKRTPMGRFEKGAGFQITTRKDANQADDANDDNKAFKKQFLGTVKIQRHGDAVVPVEIVIRFKDGSVEKRQWDGEYRWVKYTFLRSTEIESVDIDPARKYRLDVSFANNSWVSKYQVELSTHWSASILFWIENLMLCLTSVA